MALLLLTSAPAVSSASPSGASDLQGPPLIYGISPASGPTGTEVVVHGSYFGSGRGSSYVRFSRANAEKYLSWSDNRIDVIVPPRAVTGDVKVVTGFGKSNGMTFTVAKKSLQPQTAAATTPTWFLPEGSTDHGFDAYITIENPNIVAVTATVEYMTRSGPRQRPVLALPAKSQTTLNPKGDIGNTDFSTKVDCRERYTIVVDRTMTWTGHGAQSPEGHNSIGVTSPAQKWYLPEGSSAWGFECWLLVQNPYDIAAVCTITYMTEDSGPIKRQKMIAARSRASFNMRDDIGERNASIMVESEIPVIPERAMYRNNRREGHDSIGTTCPSSNYYLAEGTTAWGFTTYVLVQNPNQVNANVNITYMTDSGARSGGMITMPPNSRETVRVNDVMPNTDFSTRVNGNVPIICERAMYWDSGFGEACHDSIGVADAHSSFYFPDGQSSDGRETWTLVQNPNATGLWVEISYLTPSGKGNTIFTEYVFGLSRKTFNMGAMGITGRASITVECKKPGAKIMAERAIYWNNRGAGTNTIGGYSN